MYSSPIDVRNALTPGGSSSDATTAASLSDEQLQDAISEADSTILAYLGQRYTITQVDVEQGEPVETVSLAVAPVRWWSRDIAAFLATLTFKRNKDVPPDEPVRLRYNSAMASLTAVRDGQMELDLPAVDEGTGDITVVNLYEGTLFGPEDFALTKTYVPAFHVWPGGT